MGLHEPARLFSPGVHAGNISTASLPVRAPGLNSGAFHAHYDRNCVHFTHTTTTQMAKKNRKSNPGRPGRDAAKTVAGVRIIGGQLRGRRINYSGDARTRPMKDRLREAIFNLIGPSIRGKHVLDLFAGTGALALEALSRAPTGPLSSNSTFRPQASFAGT